MCNAQGLRADRTETKQVWVRFGGRSRPVDIRRDQEGEFEGTAREMMGIQADVEFYLVADGRSIGWKEAERLEDRMVVEVLCRMNGGGQKKKALQGETEARILQQGVWNLRGAGLRGRCWEDVHGGVLL